MRRPLLLLLVALPLSAALSQDATDRVITEAWKPSPLEDNLRQLRDEVGGRVPGTRATQEAVEWGLDALKKALMSSGKPLASGICRKAVSGGERIRMVR